jgi:hypothetical protein
MCDRQIDKNKFLVGTFGKNNSVISVGKLLQILLRVLEMKQIFPGLRI